ncbi:guanine nucleotide exchange factor [Anaeramoeba flamelloides]|uniref:Guanine nucleotide exchange factor n=1 Tax=Anaeramoeba flamelloides TaxID=1746091 RepID=A0ABQ8YQN9_9EUKA|nr:guanine nucleotide exchange factor [Anaeramoeba flamelloides]
MTTFQKENEIEKENENEETSNEKTKIITKLDKMILDDSGINENGESFKQELTEKQKIEEKKRGKEILQDNNWMKLPTIALIGERAKSNRPDEEVINKKLRQIFEEWEVEKEKCNELLELNSQQKWKIILLKEEGSRHNETDTILELKEEDHDLISSSHVKFVSDLILHPFQSGNFTSRTHHIRKRFIANKYKKIQKDWNIFIQKTKSTFSQTIVDFFHEGLNDNHLGFLYFVLTWIPSAPYDLSSLTIVDEEHSIPIQTKSELFKIIYYLWLDILNNFYFDHSSLESRTSFGELEDVLKIPDQITFPEKYKEYILTSNDFINSLAVIKDDTVPMNLKSINLKLLAMLSNNVLSEGELIKLRNILNKCCELFDNDISFKLKNCFDQIYDENPLILQYSKNNSRYLKDGMTSIKVMLSNGNLEHLIVRKDTTAFDVVRFCVNKFDGNIYNFVLFSSTSPAEWADPNKKGKKKTNNSSDTDSTTNSDTDSDSDSNSDSGSSLNSENENENENDGNNNNNANSENVNIRLEKKSFALFEELRKGSYKENGEFLNKNQKVYKYKYRKLMIRKLVQDQCDIFLPSYFQNLKKTWTTVETSTPVSKISSLLLNTYNPPPGMYGISMKGKTIQETDNLKNNKQKLVQSTEKKKEIVKKKKNYKKFPFFEVNSEIGQEEIDEELDKRVLIFGYWAPSSSDKPLSYYYDLASILNYDYLKYQHKPGKITLILPDNRKKYLVVDFSILVENFIKFIQEAYSLKTEDDNEDENIEVKFILLCVEYKMNSNFNDEDVSELIMVKKNKSLSEEGIAFGSVLKLIITQRKKSINHNIIIEEEKGEIKKIPDDLGYWYEKELNVKNLIWEKDLEKQSNKKLKLYEKIRGASFNKSIEILTDPDNYTVEFLDVFYESLPIFSSVEFFMKKLFESFEIPKHYFKNKLKKQNLNNDENGIKKEMEIKMEKGEKKEKEIEGEESEESKEEKEERERKQLLILKIIIQIYEHKAASLSQEVKGMVLSFARDVVMMNESEKVSEKGMQIELMSTKKDRVKPINNWKTFEDFENKVTQKRVKPEPIKLPKFPDLKDLTFFDLNNTDVANLLSLFGHNMLTKIKTSELLDSAWTSKNKLEISPNVMAFIHRFNRVADWCSTLILREEDNKQRIKLVVKLLNLALHLRKMNNYNDLLALMAGMECSAVARLDGTWKRLPSEMLKTFEQLSSLTNAIGGYQELRRAYTGSTLPMIPFLGLFLTDLTYTQELPKRLENNLINWAKKRRVYNVIRFIKKCQSVKYNVIYFRIVKEFFERDAILTEDEMWELSLQIEKPNW